MTNTINNIRTIKEGNFTALHSVYNLGGEQNQVVFKILEFDGNHVAKRWDAFAAIAPANPSGHTQVDGNTQIFDLDKTDENKALVENFVYDVLHGRNLERLTNYFNGDNYIQHNSAIADGLSGLGEALAVMAEAGISMVYNKTELVLGQGNFVLTVSEGTFADVPTVYFDLFRVENGFIAEHWDIMMSISPKS